MKTVVICICILVAGVCEPLVKQHLEDRAAARREAAAFEAQARAVDEEFRGLIGALQLHGAQAGRMRLRGSRADDWVETAFWESFRDARDFYRINQGLLPMHDREMQRILELAEPLIPSNVTGTPDQWDELMDKCQTIIDRK